MPTYISVKHGDNFANLKGNEKLHAKTIRNSSLLTTIR
jgi:hypothetical protein